MPQGIHTTGKAALWIWMVLAMLAVPASAHAAEGVMLTVSGKVGILSYGASQPCKSGLRIRPGNTVVSLGGRASGMLEDGRVFKVGQGQSYEVPGDYASGPAGALASRFMDTIRETVSRGRVPAVQGAARDRRELRLAYPHNAHILPGEVRFEWEGMEGVERVMITLTCPSPVYRETFISSPGETGALLPREAPPLIPGVRYYWRIQGMEGLESGSSASALTWFAVLEPDRIREMESNLGAVDVMDYLDEPDRNLIRAGLLISYGLYHRAAGILKTSLERFPEDPGMKELLGGLLLKMNKIEEANAVL